MLQWMMVNIQKISDAAELYCIKANTSYTSESVLNMDTDTLERQILCQNGSLPVNNIQTLHASAMSGISASILVICIIVSIVSYRFRRHIRVIVINKLPVLKRFRREMDVPNDVFITYNEWNMEIRTWAIAQLFQHLARHHRYRVILPEFFLIGIPKAAAI